MGIPSQSLTVRDPGLGIGLTTDTAIVVFGCSSIGNTNEITAHSSPSSIVTAKGQGPLAELGSYIASVAGGPVYLCRLAGSTAGVSSAVTKTAAGGSTGTVTLAGAPFDRYGATIEIMGTGTVGVGTFRYSLDGKRTYSETLTIPSGGTYAIPNTNITATFVPGAGAVFFLVGDLHDFTTTAPHYGSTELAAGFAALGTFLSITPGIDVKLVFLAGRNATGSGAATLFGSLTTQIAAQATSYRYMRAVMDVGSGDTTANVKTAFASVASAAISVVYGDADISSSKPFAGFGAPKQSALNAYCARLAGDLISTDPARFASGPLPGVLAISHDEFLTEVMDSAKITTLRTWPAAAGYYVTNGRLKSPAGSDFLYIQHGRVMDVACSVTAKVQLNFINRGVVVKDDGTIDESEALQLESIARGPLEDSLSSPKNIEGRAGHVSEFAYAIDRANNVLTSETVQSEVAIRPLAYAKKLVTQIGFAANVGG